MASIYNVAVKVFVTGAAKGSRELRGLGTAGNVAAAGMAVAGAAAVAMAAKILSAGTAYEDLRARLKGVTGSQEAANASFATLKRFAAETPFQLKEVTDAYIRLKAVGIEPTSDRMKAFGNIAATFGRSMTDVAGAVSSAITGEMEALKSFGIVARQEGDKVKFTFRGVTTEVGRNAQDIVSFLEQIGETDFSTGMEDRAKTLTGKLSTLSDAVDNLASLFYEGPLSDGLKQGVDLLTKWIDATAKAIEGIGGMKTILLQLGIVAMKTLHDVYDAFLSLVEVGIKVQKVFLGIGESLSWLPGMGKSIEAMQRDMQRLTELQEFVTQVRDTAGKFAGEGMLMVLKRVEDAAKGAAEAAEEAAGGESGGGGGGLEAFRKKLEEATDRVVELAKQLREMREMQADQWKPFEESLERVNEDLPKVEEFLQAAADVDLSPTNEAIDEMSRGVDGMDIDRLINGFVAWGDVAARVLGSISAGLGQVAAGAANAAATFGQMRDFKAAGGYKTTAGKAQGGMMGMDMGKSMADAVRGFGFTVGSRGTSQWGGDLGGNYADKAAEIGGAIGGMFGPVWGAVGAAAGLIIGSFVKKGADESLATINQIGDELSGRIDKAEGKLGDAMQQLIDSVIGSVEGIEDAIGAEITTGKFGLKIRGELVSVFVNGLTRRFKTMDEALTFAVSEVLRTGTFGEGASANAQAILKQGFASMEQLQYAVGIVEQVDAISKALRSSEFEQGLQSAHDGLLNLADAVTSLGGNAEDVFTLLNKNMKEEMDAFRGIQESEADRIRRTAQELNRERDRVEAQLLERLASLQEQIAGAEGMEGVSDLLSPVLDRIKDAGGLAAETIGLLGVTLTQLSGTAGVSSEEIQAQIAGIQAALAGLPDLLTEEDIQGAINRKAGGGGGGRNARQFWEGERQFVRDVAARGLNEVARIQRDYADALEEVQRRGKLAHSSMEELAAAEAQLKRERDDALRAIGESSLAALNPMADLAFRMRDLGEDIAFLRDNAEALGFTLRDVDTAVRAFGDLRFGDIAGELAGMIGDEQLIAELRKAEQIARIAYLEFEAAKLHEMGALSEEQFARIVELAQRAKDALDQAEQDTSGAGVKGTGGKGGVNVTRPGTPDFEVLDRIGLPLRAVRLSFAELGKDLRYLRENSDKLGLSAENVANIIRRVGRVHFLEVGTRLAEMTGNEHALRQMQQLRHKMELAQIKIQIEAMDRLGLITKSEKKFLDDLYDAAKKLEFDPPGPPPPPDHQNTIGRVFNPLTGKYQGGFSGGPDLIAQFQQQMYDAYERLLQLESEAAGSGSPLEETIASLSREFEELQRVLGPSERITKLWVEAVAEAIEEFNNQIDDFQRGLAQNDQLSPLKLGQRYNLALESFQSAIAAGDIEAAMRRAQELLQLGTEVFPTGGAAYGELFRTINEALDALQAQIVDDATSSAGQKIDTTALQNELRDIAQRQKERDDLARRQRDEQTNEIKTLNRRLLLGGMR